MVLDKENGIEKVVGIAKGTRDPRTRTDRSTSGPEQDREKDHLHFEMDS